MSNAEKIHTKMSVVLLLDSEKKINILFYRYVPCAI